MCVESEAQKELGLALEGQLELIHSHTDAYSRHFICLINWLSSSPSRIVMKMNKRAERTQRASSIKCCQENCEYSILP